MESITTRPAAARSQNTNRCAKQRRNIHRCRARHPTKAALKAIVVGAPASGKGTQCKKLVESRGVVHVATGDLLRAEVAAETELGQQAKQYMDSGKLVPTELVVDMVVNRVEKGDCKQKGWLLDGFPRSKEQAEELDRRNIVPNAVVSIEVPEEELVSRVTGRRLDPETGEVYHLEKHPPEEGIVHRLVRREDDTEERARARLEVHREHENAVHTHFAGVVKKIDGDKGQEEVFNEIEHALDEALELQ